MDARLKVQLTIISSDVKVDQFNGAKRKGTVLAQKKKIVYEEKKHLSIFFFLYLISSISETFGLVCTKYGSIVVVFTSELI